MNKDYLFSFPIIHVTLSNLIVLNDACRSQMLNSQIGGVLVGIDCLLWS
jgi:hypothetical protein